MESGRPPFRGFTRCDVIRRTPSAEGDSRVSSPPFDVAVAERWFAIQYNNIAWDLVESASRVPRETERMLHAAHAACLHWSAVGTPLNRLRALVLLTFAYAVADRGDEARRYAQLTADEQETLTEDVPAFDQASIAAATACAFRAANDTDATEHWLARTRELAAQITEADGAKVVETLALLGATG